MTGSADMPGWPRLLSRERAAKYCGVSVDSFDGLVERGAVPKSVSLPGIRRVLWDRGRLDDALDRLVSVVQGGEDESREARKAKWEKRREGGSKAARGRNNQGIPIRAEGRAGPEGR